MAILFRRLVLIVLLFSFFSTDAQELPPANQENSFFMLPLFDYDVSTLAPAEDLEEQYIKMKNDLRGGNLYHRLGFSMIFTDQLESSYINQFEIAKKHDLHLGLIFALQSHTRPEYREIADKDLRNYQWRLDGLDWKGSFTNSGELEIPEDQRDYKIPTPSRYAKDLIQYNQGRAENWAKSVLGLMERYPGIVTTINGPIEEELVIGGIHTEKLGDYSPYAITEYRDWLRHSGLYDASAGEFAGEGAISLIIGSLVDFNGTMRSQFYDDPTPMNSNGTGLSFNEFFGTNFQSWSLKYWDLSIYTDPITDEDFDLSPEEGLGFYDGGFDAPRVVDSSNPFWKAWSYDVPDNNGQYPVGNPSTPAYGFRQNLVRNFTRDLFKVLLREGLPANMMYAHQIPGEALGDFTGESERNRSSASTIWTGYMEQLQTVGITHFGLIDPTLMTQYADDWGVFEWHPQPFALPESQSLYDASMSSLNSFYNNKCHILFPGWWSHLPPTATEIFPLNDSKFSEAIADFLDAREEVPYHVQGNSFDYTPPVVKDFSAVINSGELLMKWDSMIWNGLLAKWPHWEQFDHFEVQWSEDGTTWDNTGETEAYFYRTLVANELYKCRVRAHSTIGHIGPWSEIECSIPLEGDITLVIDPEYSNMFFDEKTTNVIKIKADNPDQILDTSLLDVTLTGDGISLNTLPVGYENIELFWPMNSIEEGYGYNALENMEFRGGLMTATVSVIEPIDPYFSLSGSELNGAELPYIALRMYSSEATIGELLWFHDSEISSLEFGIQKGWNVYQVGNLPSWISLTSISNVRIDAGILGGTKLMIDWFGISSTPISDQVESALYFENNEAILLTTPYGQPGSYTIQAEYDNNSETMVSTTVITDEVNILPTVSLILPAIDTIIENGNAVKIEAISNDPDGSIIGVRFLSNGLAVGWETEPPYSFEWTPARDGEYSIEAETFDNVNGSTRSLPVSVKVISQKPFLGEPHRIPGLIEAEDYDIGGQGIAYSDLDADNLGMAYRDDGVDIVAIPDHEEEYAITSTEDNEWMEYTVDVAASKKYKIIVTILTAEDGGELHFEINDVRITNNIIVEPNGDDLGFVEYSIKDIFIPQGIFRLKAFIDKGGIAIDDIVIKEYDIEVSNDPEIIIDGLSLYPNPVEDLLTFTVFGEQFNRVELRSITGKLVKRKKFYSAVRGKLNVADLPIGIYIVNVFSGDKIRTGKIVKY